MTDTKPEIFEAGRTGAAGSFARLLDAAERWCFRASCAGVVAMMLLVSADALGRFVLHSPITGAYELTEDYLMVILVFLGLSYSYRKGAFVRVTSFTRFFPRRLRLVLERVSAAAAAVVVGAIAAGGFDMTVHAIRIGEFSSNLLQYPLAPAYALVVVGCALLALRLLQSLFAAPSSEDAEETPSFE
ncbi:MAG: TRAP transporter small permease [Burkholderiaceae bacterium]|nr:TRAP transporter small permease [Burkholderiaceae bacterium]